MAPTADFYQSSPSTEQTYAIENARAVELANQLKERFMEAVQTIKTSIEGGLAANIEATTLRSLANKPVMALGFLNGAAEPILVPVGGTSFQLVALSLDFDEIGVPSINPVLETSVQGQAVQIMLAGKAWERAYVAKPDEKTGTSTLVDGEKPLLVYDWVDRNPLLDAKDLETDRLNQKPRMQSPNLADEGDRPQRFGIFFSSKNGKTTVVINLPDENARRNIRRLLEQAFFREIQVEMINPKAKDVGRLELAHEMMDFVEVALEQSLGII